jgi:SAM-dependent methyltransferase
VVNWQGMKPGWYENFFQGLALEMWRGAVTQQQTRAEAGFLEKELRAAAGARLLDVPCGDGRIALELAARGYRMTGVDLSAEFVAEARQHSGEAGVDIEWRKSDMRQLPWKAAFDGAFCFGNSFGYLDAAGMQEFVEALAGALKPGARFVLQTGIAAESILPHYAERRWYEVGDVVMLIANEYDAANSCLDTNYTFLRGGQRETAESSHWVYTAAEIQRLLARAGLETQGLYGDLEREPFGLGSHLLYLVAQRGRPLLQHKRLGEGFGRGLQMGMAHQQSRAGVPAQQRVVVGRRPQGLGFFVPLHSLMQPVIDDGGGPLSALVKKRLATALADHTGIVGALVRIMEARGYISGLADRHSVLKLIGKRQQQGDQRGLILRLYAQHILTDAFCLPRLVQQAIALGLRERARHGLLRQALQFKHAVLLSM